MNWHNSKAKKLEKMQITEKVIMTSTVRTTFFFFFKLARTVHTLYLILFMSHKTAFQSVVSLISDFQLHRNPCLSSLI